MQRVIPRATWARFVHDFSAAHYGWLVSVAGRNADGGSPGHEGGLPLEGLALQLDGTEETLAIIGRQDAMPHGHLLRSIPSPVAVTLEEAGERKDKTLYIESAGGVRTVVRFRPVPIPDMTEAVKRSSHE